MLSADTVRFSLPGKIFAGFVALLLTFGGVSLYTVAEIRHLGDQLNNFHEDLVPLPSIVSDVKGDLRRIKLVMDIPDRDVQKRARRLLKRTPQTRDNLVKGFADIGARLERIRLSGKYFVSSSRFEAFDESRLAFFEQLEQYFEASTEPGELGVAERRVRTALARLDRDLTLFSYEVTKELNAAALNFEKDEQRVAWGSIVLAAVAIFIGVLITYNANRLLRPLRTLRKGLEQISRGEYGQRVEISAEGEIGALAQELNRMSEAIHRRDEQLSAQQKELLHRERLATVGKLSAQITHELRNPLSSIGLNSELLMEELDAPEEGDLNSAKDLLENIIREVERLRDITEEYLSFARLPRPDHVAVDLNHTAAELLEFVRGEMQQAGVKTRLDPDPASRPAWVDPNQLRAALLNLIRNAREAMNEGGHLVLRVRSVGGQATVEVMDDGAGIPEDLTERLFEPFFSTKPQGTGLGLPMVKQIMEALEGDVTVDKRSGGGTCVRLSLPLANEQRDAVEGRS